MELDFDKITKEARTGEYEEFAGENKEKKVVLVIDHTHEKFLFQDYYFSQNGFVLDHHVVGSYKKMYYGWDFTAEMRLLNGAPVLVKEDAEFNLKHTETGGLMLNDLVLVRVKFL